VVAHRCYVVQGTLARCGDLAMVSRCGDLAMVVSILRKSVVACDGGAGAVVNVLSPARLKCLTAKECAFAYPAIADELFE
jgi:hypothetical protein